MATMPFINPNVVTMSLNANACRSSGGTPQADGSCKLSWWASQGTGMKIGIIGGGAVLVGSIAYLLLSPPPARAAAPNRRRRRSRRE